ncbi:plasmid recombination protein [Nesterenkonia sp. NBAIMH1]|uniref:plasmid recombination protein n=1 Tax=Nesterenkonia sp. NBAIMH1 TaxID=2600320 RepID=UPI00143DD3DC|nr:plasmid recombination protein [Nesterenkonia sp. NBAIMH1]
MAGTYTDKRTGEVRKRKIRSDAKVVRSVVLQLDPDWTRSCEHLLAQAETGDTEAKQQVEAMTWRMVDRYGQKYGRQNLLAASFHWDETSPHIHLMITPIDDEGRVRNQSFIPDGRGPQSAMAMNDREMRQFLILKGYDADPQPIGDARSHMHQDDYARWREEQEQHKAREVELADREMRLGKREKVAEQRERMVDEYESEVGERDDEAQRLAEESARQNEIARRAVEEAEAREREMTEALEKHRAARQWYLAAGQSMKRAVDAANALWREAQKAGFRPTTDKEFKDAVREVSQLYGRSKSPTSSLKGPRADDASGMHQD